MPEEKTYPQIMGILNVTPDSFSGDGLAKNPKVDLGAGLDRVRAFLEQGADIIDVGGESSRPGAEPVPAELEKSRILPVIRAIKAEFPDVVISVDTVKAETAREALEAGASIVNDVTALAFDPSMADIVRDFDCKIVLMDNQARQNALSKGPGGLSFEPAADIHNMTEIVVARLKKNVANALEKGISASNIILDPGVGFGKTVEQNLDLIRNIAKFSTMGFPVLIGASRKSFIGHLLDAPVEERLEGGLAVVSVAMSGGCDIIRTHDVAETVRFCRMLSYLYQGASQEMGQEMS